MGNLFDQFDAPSEASQPTLEPAPTPAAPPPNAPSKGPLADFAPGLRAGINTLRTAGGELLGVQPGPVAAFGKKLSSAAEGRGAQLVGGYAGWPDPTPQAIRYLSQNPETVPEFERKYGKNAAAFHLSPLAPTTEAVRFLNANPGSAAQFDAKYGKGAAAFHLHPIPRNKES